MMIPGVNPSTDKSVNGFIEKLAAQARVTNQNVKNSIKENLKSFWFEATRNAIDVPIAEQCGSFNEKAFAFIDDMVKSGRCTRKESTRLKDKIAAYMDTLAKTDKEITTMSKRNAKSEERVEVIDTPAPSTEAFDNALDTEQQPGVVAIPNETVAAIAAATKAKVEEEATENVEAGTAKSESEQVQQNEPGEPELEADAGEPVPKVKAVIDQKDAKETEGQQQVNINITQQVPPAPQSTHEPQVTSIPEVTEEVNWFQSQLQMANDVFQQPCGNPNDQQFQQPQMPPQGNSQASTDCANCTSFDVANQAIQNMYQMQAAMQYQRMLYAQQQMAMQQQAQQMVVVVNKNKRLNKRCKDLKRKNDRVKFGLITGGIVASIFGAMCLKKNYDENGTIWPQF